MTYKSFFRRGLRKIGREYRKVSHALGESTWNGNYTKTVLEEKFAHFGIRRLAILIDNESDASSLPSFPDIEIIGYFAFSLDMVERAVNGRVVRPLLPEAPVATDGWLCCTRNPFSRYNLNDYLLKTGNDSQVIVSKVRASQRTNYYSYVDFFSNEQQTIVQVHNYLDRLYRIPFPLDLKYTLRDREGSRLQAGQIILPRNGIRTLKSTDFAVRDFVGYLELEFEIPNKIQPFLHYMVDYVSPDFVSSNHQSGLGLHPSGSCFTRGYVPDAEDESLIVCLFQRNYAKPVEVIGRLHYRKDGIDHIAERTFPPLHRKEMAFHDIKKMFGDFVDFTSIYNTYVVIQAPRPLHRPNFYYTKLGKKGFYDTSHAGPDLRFEVESEFNGISTVTTREREGLAKLGIAPMELSQFVFPSEFELDSWLGMGDDMTVSINSFDLICYNQQGQVVENFPVTLDFDRRRYFNLSQMLADRGLCGFSGVISLLPGPDAREVPIDMNGMSGFSHRRNPYLSTTAGSGGGVDNTPLYFRGGPRSSYIGNSAIGFAEIFARGVCNHEFDTFYAIAFRSADRTRSRSVRYEIELVNADGEKRLITSQLSLHGSAFIRLSDLVSQTALASPEGYYTVWIYCPEAHLYGQHLLYRCRDHAIALEHCYVGKHVSPLH